MSGFLHSPVGVVLGMILGAVVGIAPCLVVLWWLNRRDQGRWELREQLREMERAIREEAMSEEEREWCRQYRARQAAIQQEARRRLGLPEEE
jgi:ABC-type transport system involved in cytochrome bd biosynthesis fused ATPase/permease subunit